VRSLVVGWELFGFHFASPFFLFNSLHTFTLSLPCPERFFLFFHCFPPFKLTDPFFVFPALGGGNNKSNTGNESLQLGIRSWFTVSIHSYSHVAYICITSPKGRMSLLTFFNGTPARYVPCSFLLQVSIQTKRRFIILCMIHTEVRSTIISTESLWLYMVFLRRKRI